MCTGIDFDYARGKNWARNRGRVAPFLSLKTWASCNPQKIIMITRTFKHIAVAVGLAGAVSLAAVTPSSARWHGHWGPGAAIGAGIAGLALGAAAAAAAAAPYYDAPYGNAPGAVVVARPGLF